MISILKTYPLTLLTVAVICYLSFFTPPQTELDNISNIDKLVHTCMYGGLSIIIWWEYLRKHDTICWKRFIPISVVFPIMMSGIIELLQAYCTTNRSGEWLDFAANSFGVILAFIADNFVLRRIMKK